MCVCVCVCARTRMSVCYLHVACVVCLRAWVRTRARIRICVNPVGNVRIWNFLNKNSSIEIVFNAFAMTIIMMQNRLFDLVVKASASNAEDSGSIPAFAVDLFSRSSHINDLRTGTPIATLPGAWRYSVSTGTGQPAVSIL